VEFLVIGLGLGLGAGLAPGPLLALVITATLARGFGAGARVAASPLVTDALIITVSVLLVHSLPDTAASALGVVGGLYTMWLGVESLRERSVDVEGVEAPADHDAATALTGPDDPAAAAGAPRGGSDLRRGALVNVLSPHPWLFWIGVGGPVLLAAWADSTAAAVGFLVGFFALLIGTKVAAAALVAAGRTRLSPAGLRRAHLAAGILLLLTGLVLTVQFARALL
jgi:threonine/homoserine/homoserine lactone efflux protein